MQCILSNWILNWRLRFSNRNSTYINRGLAFDNSKATRYVRLLDIGDVAHLDGYVLKAANGYRGSISVEFVDEIYYAWGNFINIT